MASSILIRPATVADAAAISAVHCSNVTQWQKWEMEGPRPARYVELSAYQRWLNGGAWFDAGSCAHHLDRLIKGGGSAWVAELGGRVLAESEMFIADEPEPYGRNLNLSILYVHRNHQGQGLGSALMVEALALARREGCENFLVANAEAPDFYRRQGLKRMERWRRLRVPTRASKAQYEAEPLADGPYALVQGWGLVMGRYQNARHDWERVRPGSVPDFEEWRDLKGERFAITVGRQKAIVAFEEQERGLANTFLFTPPEGGYTPRLFGAVRDLALKRGFSQLQCFVRSDMELPEGVKTDYVHEVFRKRV